MSRMIESRDFLERLRTRRAALLEAHDVVGGRRLDRLGDRADGFQCEDCLRVIGRQRLGGDERELRRPCPRVRRVVRVVARNRREIGAGVDSLARLARPRQRGFVATFA